MKKALSVILCLALFAATLSACADSPAEPSSSAELPSSETVSESSTGGSGEPELVGNMYTSGLPIVKEKQTFHIFTGEHPRNDPFAEMQIWKTLEEETNIHIEWQIVPNANINEQKNLLLASGQYPDAFIKGVGAADALTYGQQGVLLKLDEYIEKYGENVKAAFEKSPLFKSLSTSVDGNTYMLGWGNETGEHYIESSIFIYQPWLDKLELEMPETWDDFYNTLVAFRDKDPNGNGQQDEIPMTYRQGTADIHPLFAAFGLADCSNHLLMEDGKVIFTADKPEYKNALLGISKLYTEKLLDREGFTQEISLFYSKCQSDPVIVGAIIGFTPDSIVGLERRDDYVPLPPFVGPNGERMCAKTTHTNGNIKANGLAITKSCKDPETLFRWFDNLFSVRNSAQLILGPIGEVLEEQEDGYLKVKEAPEGTAWYDWSYRLSPVQGIGLLTVADYGTAVDYAPPAGPKTKLNNEIYLPYATQETMYSLNSYTKEENEYLAAEGKDLSTYIGDTRTDWLLNGGIEEGWDAYIAQMDKMGLDKYLEIHQMALDRFLAGGNS